jgi:endonuclease-3
MRPTGPEVRWGNGPRTISAIVRRLEKAYGPRPWRKHASGVEGLVQTILSQNTTDKNSAAALRALRARFASWEEVIEAPTADVALAIRSGGLAQIKAPRIQAALRAVQAKAGRLSLAFLARRPIEEAKAFLQSLDGIGPKTASCVLMFCYNRPALPVDTHVHRVARRLGLIVQRCTAERAHEVLESNCPAKLVYSFHVLMVEHGRRVCRAQSPRCKECVLADRCPSRA